MGSVNLKRNWTLRTRTRRAPTSNECNQDSFKIRKYIRILTDWLYFLDTKIDCYSTSGDIYLFLLRTFTHLPVDFKTFCLLILFFGKR
ncbi:unnamed protein product [Rhizophagus irregularis]|nr:unnamed protein product [Rhizophagus irregularis]CAB5373676.1 unnamed protein product [Rhizophagus irregularis]